MTDQRPFLVDDQWALRITGDVIDVVSPHPEEFIGTAEAPGPDEADRAHRSIAPPDLAADGGLT